MWSLTVRNGMTKNTSTKEHKCKNVIFKRRGCQMVASFFLLKICTYEKKVLSLQRFEIFFFHST